MRMACAWAVHGMWVAWCTAQCALLYVHCPICIALYALCVQEGEDLQIVDVHSSSIIHVPQTKFNPNPDPNPDPDPPLTLNRSRFTTPSSITYGYRCLRRGS